MSEVAADTVVLLTTPATLCALVDGVSLRSGEWTSVDLAALDAAQRAAIAKYIGTGHINLHSAYRAVFDASVAADAADAKGGRKRG